MRCIFFLACAVLFAQTPPATFEVADIKPSDPNVPMPGKGRVLPGGRIELPGVTLKIMIMSAWGVQENMISGLPKWAESDRFDLVAKAPRGTPNTDLRLMLQPVIADYFKLAFHREDRLAAAYVLTVGKGGSKLAATAGDSNPEDPLCHWLVPENGLRRRECHNTTMAELTRELPGLGGAGIDRPVLDQTGLNGAYDFHFDVGVGKPDDPGPTIFEALEKLGLRLESRKTAVSVLVVDRVEKP
jgi:uncharacterized protein (TIGR03435 family)